MLGGRGGESGSGQPRNFPTTRIRRSRSVTEVLNKSLFIDRLQVTIALNRSSCSARARRAEWAGACVRRRAASLPTTSASAGARRSPHRWRAASKRGEPISRSQSGSISVSRRAASRRSRWRAFLGRASRWMHECLLEARLSLQFCKGGSTFRSSADPSGTRVWVDRQSTPLRTATLWFTRHGAPTRPVFCPTASCMGLRDHAGESSYSRRRHARSRGAASGVETAGQLVFAEEFFGGRGAATSSTCRRSSRSRRCSRSTAGTRRRRCPAGVSVRGAAPASTGRYAGRCPATPRGTSSRARATRSPHDLSFVVTSPSAPRVYPMGARRHDGLFHGFCGSRPSTTLRLPDALRVLQGARGVPARVGDHSALVLRGFMIARHRRHPALPPDAPPLAGILVVRLEDAPGARPAAPPRRPAAAAPSSCPLAPPSHSRRTTWTWPTTR